MLQALVGQFGEVQVFRGMWDWSLLLGQCFLVKAPETLPFRAEVVYWCLVSGGEVEKGYPDCLAKSGDVSADVVPDSFPLV